MPNKESILYGNLFYINILIKTKVLNTIAGIASYVIIF